jgi:hypothetical protein
VAATLISELDAVPIAVAGVAVGEATAVLGLADKQPLIDTRAREPIKSNGNAYLSGVLIYRFIILAIGFKHFPPCFAPAVTYGLAGKQNVRSCKWCGIA